MDGHCVSQDFTIWGCTLDMHQHTLGPKGGSSGALSNQSGAGMQASWDGRLFEHDAGRGLTGALIARVAPCAGPTPGKAGPLSPLKDGLLWRASSEPPANLPPDAIAGCSNHLSSTGALDRTRCHAEPISPQAGPRTPQQDALQYMQEVQDGHMCGAAKSTVQVPI